MSEYTPHLWEIVRLTTDNDQVDKVIGSWYGGFGGSDNWRLSSGIVKIDENDSHYQVHNESGSVYTCHKQTRGMSSYTHMALKKLGEELKTIGGKLEVLDIANILDTHK